MGFGGRLQLPAQAQSPIDSINQYVGFELRRQRIPGASVAILRGDRVLLARGYGFANLELGVPASDSTIYQSGSLGKQFTAAAVLMLAEQGRLAIALLALLTDSLLADNLGCQ
jgi:CubicO group peptidase (beta-lactamase class C family)